MQRPTPTVCREKCAGLATIDQSVPYPTPTACREKCASLATIDGGLLLQSIHSAADGTRKMVFKVAHGPAAGGQVRGCRRLQLCSFALLQQPAVALPDPVFAGCWACSRAPLLDLVLCHDEACKCVAAVLTFHPPQSRWLQVETVLIPISREAGAKARITLCVSSQGGS